MDKEADKFEVLEEKIVRLIEAYTALKDEKASLGERLAQKEEESREMADQMTRLSQEREKAREKVESLLGRLDRLISSER